MKNEYCVYMHTLPNGLVYVGITNREPDKRWQNGRGYKENKAFFNAILLYGWLNIKHEIIYSNLTEEEASIKEAELIREYRSDDLEYGFNVQTGGVVGFTHNKDARKRISEASKKRWASDEYRKKVHDSQLIAQNRPEVKQRKAEYSRKRYYEDSEYREKLVSACRVRMNDPVLKEKYRERSKKMWDSPTFREKWNKRMAGGNNPTAKRVNQCDESGAILNTYSCCKEAAEVIGISRSCITACARGQQKTAGGYIWKYAE